MIEIKLGGEELIEKGASTLNSLASIVDDRRRLLYGIGRTESLAGPYVVDERVRSAIRLFEFELFEN